MTSFYDQVKENQVSSLQARLNDLRRDQGRTSTFDKSGSVFFSPAAVASDGTWQGQDIPPTASPQSIDLSLWGIPENAKAVYVQLQGVSDVSGYVTRRFHLLGSNHVDYDRAALTLTKDSARGNYVNAGIVPVVGDREIFYHNEAVSNTWFAMWLTITGYMY